MIFTHSEPFKLNFFLKFLMTILLTNYYRLHPFNAKLFMAMDRQTNYYILLLHMGVAL